MERRRRRGRHTESTVEESVTSLDGFVDGFGSIGIGELPQAEPYDPSVISPSTNKRKTHPTRGISKPLLSLIVGLDMMGGKEGNGEWI